MRSLGFDAYAIDKIDCADGLLWYLKREVNMHRTVRRPHVLLILHDHDPDGFISRPLALMDQRWI